MEVDDGLGTGRDIAEIGKGDSLVVGEASADPESLGPVLLFKTARRRESGFLDGGKEEGTSERDGVSDSDSWDILRTFFKAFPALLPTDSVFRFRSLATDFGSPPCPPVESSSSTTTTLLRSMRSLMRSNSA
jgi:hypothetical protein